jgi:hypothetical protein
MQVNVVVKDGKLTVSPVKLTAGKVTFVATNKGTVKHALAIMGNGLAPKRTPALAAGKSARLVVTLKPGKYHVWDPITSSMSRAKYLTVKAGSTSGSSGSGGSSGGVVPGNGSGGSTMPDYGMDGMEH